MQSVVITPPLSTGLASIRKILLAHYLRLSALSRRLRFPGVVKNEGIGLIAQRASPDLVIALEIYGIERGLLELFVGSKDHCEIAISVEDPYQGQGHGQRLLDAGMHAARDMKLKTIDLYFSKQNDVIRAMLKHVDGKIVDRGDALQACVDIS